MGRKLGGEKKVSQADFEKACAAEVEKEVAVPDLLRIYVTEEMRAQIEFVLQRYYNNERMRLQRNSGLSVAYDKSNLRKTEDALVRVKEAFRG